MNTNNEQIKQQLAAAEGCFTAAIAEGLMDRLAETEETGIGTLHDLITRRLIPAVAHIHEAQAILLAAKRHAASVGVQQPDALGLAHLRATEVAYENLKAQLAAEQPSTASVAQGEYQPKTELGKRLWAHRQRITAQGGLRAVDEILAQIDGIEAQQPFSAAQGELVGEFQFDMTGALGVNWNPDFNPNHGDHLYLAPPRAAGREESDEWQLVPSTPTYEMVQAGAQLVKKNLPFHTGTLDIYRAMLAAAPQPPHDLRREVPEKPDARQLASACFSYRHDFGLLDDAQRMRVQSECRQWWKAIARELNEPSRHPMVLAAAATQPQDVNG